MRLNLTHVLIFISFWFCSSLLLKGKGNVSVAVVGSISLISSSALPYSVTKTSTAKCVSSMAVEPVIAETINALDVDLTFATVSDSVIKNDINLLSFLPEALWIFFHGPSVYSTINTAWVLKEHIRLCFDHRTHRRILTTIQFYKKTNISQSYYFWAGIFFM